MTINGRRVYARVDSGQSLALVMSVSQSKALGLKQLSPASRGFELLGKPTVPAGSVTVSLVRHLKLGTLQANNVMATVIPDSYGADGKRELVVGLPLLARFSNIVFHESSMILNAPSVSCPHPLPATYASASGRGGLLVFDAEADGRRIKASVDTGSNVLLVAGKGLAPVTGSMDTILDSGRALHETAYRYLAVRVAKLLLRYDTTPVLPTLAFPDALIGAPALAALSIRFTFTPRPSLCLTRTRRSPSESRVDYHTFLTHLKRHKEIHLGQAATGKRVLRMPLSLSSNTGLIRTPSFHHIPTFRTPLLKGINMQPGSAIVDRYAPPPLPWVHLYIHCVVYNGNVYVDGSFTGNFGRPLPGLTEYVGRGDSAIGAFVTNDSGHFGGVIPLPASPIAAPVNMVRTPIQCVLPKVKVGTPSNVK